MRPARVLLVITILIAALSIALPVLAAPLFQRQATITSPRDGAQLTGVVQISGTAIDSKFDHYELAWALQSDPENWQMIASVQNQIPDGSLGTWDTAGLQPGVYRLRLRVVRDGDKNTDTFVNNLSINQGTPTPTAAPTEIGPTIPPTPTQSIANATPTILIVQPPTSTPQPAATGKPAAGSASSSGGPRTPSVQVNLASFSGAFCNGALYTFLLFVLWGIIWSGREVVRWGLKRIRTSAPPKE